MNRYRRRINRSGATGSQDQTWLVPILWIVISLISSATVWFLLRGTTHVTIPDCAYDCSEVVKKAPNWESWGLPVTILVFGISGAAKSILDQSLLYRVFIQHRRRDGQLRSYPRMYGRADATLDFIVVVIRPVAFWLMLAAFGALYFAVQNLRTQTGDRHDLIGGFLGRAEYVTGHRIETTLPA